MKKCLSPSKYLIRNKVKWNILKLCLTTYVNLSIKLVARKMLHQEKKILLAENDRFFIEMYFDRKCILWCIKRLQSRHNNLCFNSEKLFAWPFVFSLLIPSNLTPELFSYFTIPHSSIGYGELLTWGQTSSHLYTGMFVCINKTK
jgi:hypothetical protein